MYDGDCSLCVAVSRRLLRWTRRGEETRRAAQAFEGEDAERVAASEAHNELAVMDPATKEIRNGVDGILWWLEGSRLAWLARLLSFGPLRWAAGVGYPVIAYNRRILAPPKPRAIACACDPDPRPGATIALGAFALAVAVGAFVGVGALARAGSRVEADAIAWWAAPLGGPVEGLFTAALWILPTLALVCVVRPPGARLLHAAAFAWSLAISTPILWMGAGLQAAIGWDGPSLVLLLGLLGQSLGGCVAYARRLRMLRASEPGWIVAFALLGLVAELAWRAARS